MNRHALVLVFSNLRHDARVKRQIAFLKKDFQVTVVAFDGDPGLGVEFIRISQTRLTLFRKALLAAALLFRRFELAYRLFHDYGHLTKQLETRSFDLVVANDADTLPLAFNLARGARVLFDAHEYSPRHFEDKWWWRLFFQPLYVHLCSTWIPRVSAMTTVGKGLAREYHKHFGHLPEVITNAPVRSGLTPTPVVDGKIRLVHHGIANPSRRLDLMLDMMKHLDQRFTLDLILLTSDFASPATRKFIAAFKAEASANPAIRVLPPLPSHELVAAINHYDIGVFLLPPVNFNYENTLPNKFFEFIQAGLGIAIGPTPEMAAIVNANGLGVVAPDFTAEALARQLNALTGQQVEVFKQAAAQTAPNYCAEVNEEKFRAIIRTLFP
ncbi:MAG: hypothetical protein ACKO3B_10855 [Bacteroidota bacterium]